MTSRTIMLALVLSPPLTLQSVRAIDQVTLQPNKSHESRVLTGTINDICEGKLTLDTGTSHRDISVWHIASIESDWCAAHRRARKLAGQRAWQEAAETYRLAYREESRPWCQRLILREAAEVTRESSDMLLASKIALGIFQEDKESSYLEALPLKWDNRPVPDPWQRRALEWLSNEQAPAAQLLGASWLVGTDRSASAKESLDRLTTSQYPGIAQLADAQRWRLKMGSATAEDLTHWKHQAERMHPDLRAGPYFIIAQLIARQDSDPRSAAIAYLRVPTLYPRHATLSADALLAAGQLLSKAGDLQEASLLYDEIRAKHGTTPAARELATRNP